MPPWPAPRGACWAARTGAASSCWPARGTTATTVGPRPAAWPARGVHVARGRRRRRAGPAAAVRPRHRRRVRHRLPRHLDAARPGRRRRCSPSTSRAASTALTGAAGDGVLRRRPHRDLRRAEARPAAPAGARGWPARSRWPTSGSTRRRPAPTSSSEDDVRAVAARRAPVDSHKWQAAVWIVAGSPGMLGAAHLASRGRAAGRGRHGAALVARRGARPRQPTEVVGRSLPLDRWAAAVLDGPRPVPRPRRRARARSGATPRRTSVRELVADGRRAGRWSTATACSPLAWSPDGAGRGAPGSAAATVLTPHDGEFAPAGRAPPGRRPHRRGPRAGRASDRCRRAAEGPDDRRGRPGVAASSSSTAGDARLATAGTGDVLSGIIGALLAQRSPAVRGGGGRRVAARRGRRGAGRRAAWSPATSPTCMPRRAGARCDRRDRSSPRRLGRGRPRRHRHQRRRAAPRSRAGRGVGGREGRRLRPRRRARWPAPRSTPAPTGLCVALVRGGRRRCAHAGIARPGAGAVRAAAAQLDDAGRAGTAAADRCTRRRASTALAEAAARPAGPTVRRAPQGRHRHAPRRRPARATLVRAGPADRSPSPTLRLERPWTHLAVADEPGRSRPPPLQLGAASTTRAGALARRRHPAAAGPRRQLRRRPSPTPAARRDLRAGRHRGLRHRAVARAGRGCAAELAPGAARCGPGSAS